MIKVISIVGATASGKTSLSLKLAQQFNGEIISADSIQIYKGFDIGSGKIMPNQRLGIPHYLIDELDSNQSYDIATFQTMARCCINHINNLNKLPIMVGGSGLYVKSCLYDYDFARQDDSYVKQVEQQLQQYSNQQLYDQLVQLDAPSAQKIHMNNRIRLIRALSIALCHDENKSSMESKQQHQPIYDCYIMALTWPRDILHQRISDRVDQMIHDGLVDEIKQLLDSGVSQDCNAMRAIGYKELLPYINGQEDLTSCIGKIKTHSNQFAKRQETFFKHQFENIIWYDLSQTSEQQIINDVTLWLNK